MSTYKTFGSSHSTEETNTNTTTDEYDDDRESSANFTNNTNYSSYMNGSEPPPANPNAGTSTVKLYEKFRRRISLEQLLKQANLDRKIVLQVLEEFNIDSNTEINDETIQLIFAKCKEKSETIENRTAQHTKSNKHRKSRDIDIGYNGSNKNNNNNNNSRSSKTIDSTQFLLFNQLPNDPNDPNDSKNSARITRPESSCNINSRDIGASLGESNQFSVIYDKCEQMKESINEMCLKIQIQSCMNDMISQIENKHRIYALQQMIDKKKVACCQNFT